MPQPHSLAGMCGFFSDLTMLAALVLLAFFSAELRILGVYPASPFRAGLE